MSKPFTPEGGLFPPPSPQKTPPLLDLSVTGAAVVEVKRWMIEDGPAKSIKVDGTLSKNNDDNSPLSTESPKRKRDSNSENATNNENSLNNRRVGIVESTGLRSRGTAKQRTFTAIPGTNEVYVHCAYGCGTTYRTPAQPAKGTFRPPLEKLGKKEWHKVIRRLNSHESQRCENRPHRPQTEGVVVDKTVKTSKINPVVEGIHVLPPSPAKRMRGNACRGSLSSPRRFRVVSGGLADLSQVEVSDPNSLAAMKMTSTLDPKVFVKNERPFGSVPLWESCTF